MLEYPLALILITPRCLIPFMIPYIAVQKRKRGEGFNRRKPSMLKYFDCLVADATTQGWPVEEKSISVEYQHPMG